MQSKTKQLENFLNDNFEPTAYCGDLGSNSKVCRVGSKFRISTSSIGANPNDIEGTFDEVLSRLKEIKERWEIEKNL